MLINQSRMAEWEKCPRRFAYRYVLNLEPKRKSLKAWTGTAVHSALAAFYRGADALAQDQVFLETMLQFPQKEEAEEWQPAVELWTERLKKYRETYAEEQFKVVMVPEQELEVELAPGVGMLCRLDLMIERPDGTIWVMDHKTASKTGPSYWTKYAVDLQGSAYVYAAEKTLGREVAGWMINAIKSTKDGWFERQAFTRTREQLQSFQRQAVGRAKAIGEALEGAAGKDPWDGEMLDVHFPQYTHECYGFGNCAFLPLCSGGKAGLALYEERQSDYVDDTA